MKLPVTAQAAILQALISGPAFGLEIIDRVSTRTKGKITLNQGSIYPALRDMERDGLLESYNGDEVVPERGGRPRRYYRLTAKGAEAAMEQAQAVSSLFGIGLEGVKA
jgi:PadR family transcriptional regulator, regulatory protein PadR